MSRASGAIGRRLSTGVERLVPFRRLTRGVSGLPVERDDLRVRLVGEFASQLVSNATNHFNCPNLFRFDHSSLWVIKVDALNAITVAALGSGRALSQTRLPWWKRDGFAVAVQLAGPRRLDDLFEVVV
jgi:hypothetical protein